MDEKEKVKRTKTKTPNIYFNESTKKYDVKYNFTIEDAITKKKIYKAKWIYGLPSVAQAKTVLADMQKNGVQEKDKDVTIEGALELWKKYAKQQDLSEITVRNTTQHYKVITKYISKDTKIKDITEDIYLDVMASARADGYSEESLHSINATFKKFINLCYKKKVIHTNFLTTAEKFKTKQKTNYRLVTDEEYEMLDDYFGKGGFVRQGVDNFKEYRALIAILYWCGLRIGEALALTYNDIESFDYRKKKDQTGIKVVLSSDDTKQRHLVGKRLVVTKSFTSKSGKIKGTKNKKDRKVPIPEAVEYRLGHLNKSFQYQTDASSRNDRLFPWTDKAVNDTLERACAKLGITPKITSHCFRHTYISNLIRRGVSLPTIEKVSGDTQETILKRYSHMFEEDERMVLEALYDMQ